MRGVVKWFSDQKGYGFITAEDGEDVFVHFSAIVAEGESRKNLYEDDDVEFEISQTEKGIAATNVKKI